MKGRAKFENHGNISEELQKLYGYVRENIFLGMNSNITSRNIQLAKNLLEAIATYMPDE